MNEKNIIKLIVFILLVIIVSLYYFLKIPVKMVHKETLGIKSFYPDVREERFFRNNWEGSKFVNINFEFLVVNKEMTKSEFKELLNSKKNEHKLFIDIYPFEDTGAYFIYKTKKGFNAVAVFYYKGRTYWLAFYSSMPFNKYYDVMKNFLINMEIDGRKVDEKFIKDIEDFKIPSSILVSTELFIIIFSSILFFTILIIIFVFYIGFKKPKGIEGAILEEKTFVTAKFRFTRSNFPAYVCIKEGKVLGFSAGKKIFEKELKDIKLIKNRIIFDIEGIEYSFNVSEPERWKIFL